MTTTARNVPTQFVQTRGRTLAYRRIGQGPPLVLCLRLRGVMDVWDPAFLDALAAHFTVITFDYTGLGQSSGEPDYHREALAQDAKDLIDSLGMDRVIIGGWSLGGLAAQVFVARYAERVSHAILIGTGPPGKQPYAVDPIFMPTAMKLHYTLEDEYILFFEPASDASRRAAKASHDRIASRQTDTSPIIPEATYLKLVRESSSPEAIFADPEQFYFRTLSQTKVPILAICGDHDIVFPAENWYALNRQWQSLSVLTFPQAGHGPQHQHPELCAETIASFVHHIK
ncbi:MAG: alpha/beta hydrolase [Planctomycetia bacterium]|nr:alpha/beta hydrolase [Planctomycetia bacterium]